MESLLKDFHGNETVKIICNNCQLANRIKRNTGTRLSNSAEISFKLQGQSVILDLDPSHKFPAMSMTMVERQDGNLTTVEWLSTNCLRAGSIRGIPGSNGTLNVCDKLVSIPSDN